METEKGVIIAAYKIKAKTPRFIVLKRTKNWEGWELPKGHLEDDYEGTVREEMREETGIEEEQIEEIEEAGETVEWTFEKDDEEIKREYKGFLVKVSQDATVDISNNPHDEHEQGFFLRARDVKSLLTYEDQREFLEEAEEKID